MAQHLTLLGLVIFGAVALQVLMPLIGDAVLTMIVAAVVGRLCYTWGRAA